MPNYNISYGSISVLRQCLKFNGLKELKNVQGQMVEVDQTRGLGLIESCQRNHFYKNTESFVKDCEEKIETFRQEYKKLLEEKKKELKKTIIKKAKEEEKIYETRLEKKAIEELKDKISELDKQANEIIDNKSDIEITDKTKDVIIKCLKEYGKDGEAFLVGDDKRVAEIIEVFKIEE